MLIWALVIPSVIGLLYGALVVRSNRRFGRLRQSRTGGSQPFLREFSDAGIESSVLEMVYQDITSETKIPPRRADDLEATLGLIPEDFERVVEQRCRKLGHTDIWRPPYDAHFPLKTPEDYARFLMAIITSPKLPPRDARKEV